MAKIARIRRALIVGMAPPRTPDPQRPVLGGRSCERLCRLLELPPGDLDRYFVFANLADPWEGPGGRYRPIPAHLLRDQAWRLISSHRWRGCPRVLLLGRGVAHAFGLSSSDPYLRWLDWGQWRGRKVAIFPHPGAGDRWWNDRANRARGTAFLRDVAGLPLDIGQRGFLDELE